MIVDAPPPPSDAEQQAEQTHSAAEQAFLIFLAVSVVTGEPSEEQDLHLLRGICLTLIRGIMRASFGPQGSADLASLLPDPAQLAHEVAPELLVAAREIRRAVQNPTDTTDRRSAASTLATLAYSRIAEALSRYLNKPSSLLKRNQLKKYWITRRDSRVRPLHRRLHGQSRGVKDDFWRWPDTGQVLGWPGDPRAPLSATAACRCFCLLTWSPKSDVDKVILPLAGT